MPSHGTSAFVLEEVSVVLAEPRYRERYCWLGCMDAGGDDECCGNPTGNYARNPSYGVSCSGGSCT